MRGITSTALRGLLYVLLLAAPFGCSVATRQATGPPTPAPPTPSPSQPDNVERQTSEPYKGDLSIFEDPRRGRTYKSTVSWTFSASRRAQAWRT